MSSEYGDFEVTVEAEVPPPPKGGVHRPAQSENERIIAAVVKMVREKRGVLDGFCHKPLYELHRLFLYKAMMKDERMVRLRKKIMEDKNFKTELVDELTYWFGTIFTRGLVRIILPPGA